MGRRAGFAPTSSPTTGMLGLITRFAPSFDLGHHLQTVCDRHLRWNARRAMFTYDSILGWVISGGNIAILAGLTLARLALTYDPAAFTVTAADVHLGTIPTSGSGWTLTAVVDASTGQLGITLYSLTPIAASVAGMPAPSSAARSGSWLNWGLRLDVGKRRTSTSVSTPASRSVVTSSRDGRTPCPSVKTSFPCIESPR